jgi:hypothetical protein
MCVSDSCLADNDTSRPRSSRDRDFDRYSDDEKWDIDVDTEKMTSSLLSTSSSIASHPSGYTAVPL